MNAEDFNQYNEDGESLIYFPQDNPDSFADSIDTEEDFWWEMID